MFQLRWSSASSVIVAALVLTTLSFALPPQSRIPGLSAPPAAAAAAAAVTDSFSRAVSGGWGATDSGNRYAISEPTAHWRVGDGMGSVRVPGAGDSQEAALPDVSLRDVDVTVLARSNEVATGWGQLVYVSARRRDGRNQYRAMVRFAPSGAVYLMITRMVDSYAETVLGDQVRVDGLRHRPNADVRIRLRVTGTYPTEIAAKVWPADSAEPDGWHIRREDSSGALQRAGGVGVRMYLPSDTTNAPVIFSFDDLVVREASAAAPPTQPDSAPRPPAQRPSADAGPGLPGSTSYPIPSGARFVSPSGDDRASGSAAAPWRTLQHAVEAVPSGTTIVLREGTYREQVHVWRKRVVIQSYPGETVWLSGSKEVTDWAYDGGGVWRKDGWDPAIDRDPLPATMLDPAHPLAGAPDQVFIDGRPLTQVATRSQVRAGTFAVDPVSRRLYIGDDPRDATVEASVLTSAIYLNQAHGSVVRGIGIKNYATHYDEVAAVRGYADDLVFENNIVANNAAIGVSVIGDGIRLSDNAVVSNGVMGMHVHDSDGVVIESNLVAANNAAHFKLGWAAAGVKVTSSRNIVLRGNLAQYNHATALWVDESSLGITMVRNTVLGNGRHGLMVELSADAVIASNLVLDNLDRGIHVLDAHDVDVVNNTIVGNGRAVQVFDGLRARSHPDITWRVDDVRIRNNIMSDGNGTTNMLTNVDDHNRERTAAEMDVSFNYNAYHRSSSDAPSWLSGWSNWPTGYLLPTTLAEVRTRTGQERNGIAFNGVPATVIFENPALFDYRLRDDSPLQGRGHPLSGEVAAALGLPAGTPVDVGALHLGS